MSESNNSTNQSGVFLNEALVYESFQLGKLNLITAPCGSGKTTAAFTSIPEYLNVEPRKSLILTNTVANAEEFIQDEKAYYYDYTGKEWDATFYPLHDKPTVITYALFGAKIKKGELDPSYYDYIVCDELHVLNKYIGMARGRLKKQYPQAAPWEINDMLQITCFTYIALETVTQLIKAGETWMFALTATPEQLYKNDLKQLSTIINEVQYSQKLHAYDIFCKFEYAEIEPILRNLLPENRKRLFYFNTVKELKKYKQILLDCGRAAEAIWSTEHESSMNSHQLTTRDFIIQEHRFPDDVQDLLINGAYETGINIKDPLVKEAYIHTGNKDTQEQAKSRLRQDLEIVGYYNRDKNKALKTAAAKKALHKDYIPLIPECYFNIKLFSNDKENLINTIHFPAKWTSLKKALVSEGYEVIDKSSGQARYSIIKKS